MSALAVAPQAQEELARVAAPPKPQQENVVLPRLRGDLLVTKQMYEERTYYVIKDPISLQYFRMSAEDYYLATLFDGIRTFGQIRDLYARHFPHVRLEYTAEELNERVLRFSNDLALMQFLSVQGTRLKARYDAAKKQKAKKGTFYNLVNTIFFKRFSIYDPDRLFGAMARPLWWIWTKTSLNISIALIVLACFVAWHSWGRINPSMSNFFSFSNLTLIWVTTIVIKSIHELGHGLTCKHFGSEVHEVGMMFLVFTPYFFVNVSDSWVLPRRSHRILISAAGIYVELILAAFATFLWAIVQPGPFQDFLFNVMVIASFSTLVFNANPLMRFDGYYIMTDWIEVPNLQAKSRALVTHQFKGLLFGKKGEDPVLARMPLPRKRFWLFYTYAVLSWVYGYYVIYKLTWYMADQLEARWDMRALGQFLAFSAVLAWIIMPIWTFVKALKLESKDFKPGGRLRRLIGFTAIFASMFVLLTFSKCEMQIVRSGAVELAEPDEIRAPVPGFVKEVLVKEGDQVVPGQALATLTNRELEQMVVNIEQHVEMARANMQRALAVDRPAEYKQLESQRKEYETRLEQAKKDLGNLTLKAHIKGTVLTRELERRKGLLVKSGELFCEIGSLNPMQIKMALNEKQVRYVEKGQKVELRADAYPGKIIRGTIAEVHPTLLAKDLPAALSGRRGGDVPTAIDAKGQEVPLEKTFEARVDVDNNEGLLRPGMTGQGRIEAGKHLFGKTVLQYLLDLVSLDFRF